MFCAILRRSSRLLVQNSTKTCWHPSLRSPLHPVLQATVIRCSSSSGSCSGSGSKTGIQPVSLSERTINLAHQTSYTSAKKPACMKPSTSPSCPKAMKRPGEHRYVPEPRAITRCAVEDLSKKCPQPKPVCPPKKQLTMMEIIGKTIIFIIKAAIVGGLVYWTIDIGVWGDSDDSAELFKELQVKVRALLKMKPLDTEVQEVPKTDHMYHNALVTWNRGVVMAFEVVTTVFGKITRTLGLDPEKKD